jgi:nucleoside-diphosphate kinase
MATEQTFIMIKPDGVQRGLVGEIIKRFEAKGYSLKAIKMVTVEVRTALSPIFHLCNCW